MRPMVATLDVSKLSGWLNADAVCRELKEGHTVRGEVRPAGGGRGGGRPRCKRRAGEGSTAQLWARQLGGAHVEHVAHVCYAGGVEA